MPDPQHLAIAIAVLNALALSVFGIDKLLSKTGKRRISEKALLLFSALLASPGALIGMILFNHKTSKPKFRYGVPCLLLAHAALAYWISYA